MITVTKRKVSDGMSFNPDLVNFPESRVGLNAFASSMPDEFFIGGSNKFGTSKRLFCPHYVEHIPKGVESAQFRDAVVSRHANISAMLLAGYKRIEDFSNHHEANERLLEADNALTIRDIDLSVGDTDLRKIADDKSGFCSLKLGSNDYDYRTYLILSDYVESYSLTAPTFDDFAFTQDTVLTPYAFDNAQSGLVGAINRMTDTVWWRRQLRNKQVETIEQIARDLRLVHKKSSAYLSNFSVESKRKRKEENEKLMSKMFIINEGQNVLLEDEIQTLQDVINSSSTSGEQQAAELMVRLRGTEELASDSNHSCEFYTMTAPSRFHSVLGSGHPNKKYQYGLTARDAQDYFQKIWVLARARFAKADLRPYGFRVVEPHHDGCPHWHMLLWMEKGQAKEIRKILKELCMRDSPEEAKTSTTRFKPVYIDKNKGSAVGYIAKYITKSINGSKIKEVICPKSGEIKILPAEAAERARYWASINNIRQFEAIGLPSVTIWREMRKLGMGSKGKCKVANALQVGADCLSLGDYALEKVRLAADASDWSAFCIAMGGIQVKRKDQAVRIHYQIPDLVDQLTGEVSNSEQHSVNYETKYGDRPKARVAGLSWDNVLIMTRDVRPEVITENTLRCRQKVMRGTLGQFEEWELQGLYDIPTSDEMFLLNEMVYEDKMNKALFIDAECFDEDFRGRGSEATSTNLDLCH